MRQRNTIRVGRGPIPPLSLAALAGLLATGAALASSHREAPFITENPKVDGTDFYMFQSYEPGRAGFTTLIANYHPLQDAYGGPNYFSLDPDALYEIHVDNNGDAREDITFQFRFQHTYRNTALTVGGQSVQIPLVVSGQITAAGDADANLLETYSAGIVRGGRRAGAPQALTKVSNGSAVFEKPLDNIGDKTFGAGVTYTQYADAHIFDCNIPGCGVGRVFVGQRDEPFALRLGEIFDLVDASVGFLTGARNGAPDTIDFKNITSIAIEVPTACLLGTGTTIGAWTTASLRQGRVLNPCPNPPSYESGAWVQVSRLGMPLVNEVVIGIGDKDKFNSSEPKDDTQFLTYVTNPTLPALIELLFPVVAAPTTFPRSDLVAVFLKGVPTLNANGSTGEMLRLNTAIAPTLQASQDDLGVLGGGTPNATAPLTDLAGFPNGRRPGDDVVDIALRVVEGRLFHPPFDAVTGLLPANAPAGLDPLTDEVQRDSMTFRNAFPYLNTPFRGSPTP